MGSSISGGSGHVAVQDEVFWEIGEFESLIEVDHCLGRLFALRVFHIPFRTRRTAYGGSWNYLTS